MVINPDIDYVIFVFSIVQSNGETANVIINSSQWDDLIEKK